jgi:ribosomal protein S18 acetylase RimI-like enzyme
LWVHPDHRAGGIASTLVAQVEDWARQAGAERLTLWVAQNNEPARSLYRLRGFVETGNRKDLPSNPGIKEQQMLLRLQ